MSTPTSPAPPPSDEEVLARSLLAIGQGSRRTEDFVPLSDLSKSRAAIVAAAWPELPEQARIAAVRKMSELSEERLDLSFGRALRIALDDPSPVVRQLAVTGLWEDERPDLVQRLLNLAKDDASEDVRAEAAQGLGRFAGRVAAGEIPTADGDALRATLRELAGDEASAYGVRRRALEAIAGLGGVPDVYRLIADAYAADDQGMRASAIYAMGRCLDPRWFDAVLRELESEEAELRYEAARAAGELGDDRAVPGLALLAIEPDAQVRYAAITALGQIGGRAAVRVLRNLAEHADERDAEIIEEALEESLSSVDPLQVRP